MCRIALIGLLVGCAAPVFAQDPTAIARGETMFAEQKCVICHMVVRPDAHGIEVDHHLITVMPLVGDDLVQRLRRRDTGLCVFDLLRRGRRRGPDRRRVALVGAL